MSDVWFTSDQHYGHARIIELCGRPYKSVEEMDEAMIENYNALVKPDDIIYHIGDFSFHKPGPATGIASRLNGKKHLLWGNHDHRYHGDAAFLAHWEWAKDMCDIKIGKQRIVMCHFPFLVWNKSHHGAWNIHGHSHGNLPEDPYARRVDVGVDGWNYKPVHFDEIVAVMARKKFEPIDHHGKPDL